MNVFRLVLCLAGFAAYLIAKQSLPRAEANVQPAQVHDAMGPSAPSPAGSCKLQENKERDTLCTGETAPVATESNKPTR